jgi:hypothetical protein
MDDDLDFHSGKIASNFKSVTGIPAVRRRVLGVLALICLLMVVLAVVVEHRFWWLTLTGRRTTAKIAAREVKVVGYIVRRGMREAPMYETDFQYTFTDDAGKPRQGAFTVIGSSDDFRIGQEITIMMPRFGSGPSVPASWFFYLQHDVQWLSFTVAGLVCLGVAVVCLVWRARTPAA